MRLPRPILFVRRLSVVISLWLKGDLTSRQVVRLVMRVMRFERWGVRPIREARFRGLIQSVERLAAALDDTTRRAAEASETSGAQLAALRAQLTHLSADLKETTQRAAVADRFMAQTAALNIRLDHATRRAEHLGQIEAAYRNVCARLDEAYARGGALERANQQMVEANQQMAETAATSRRGVQALLNEQQKILFEVGGDTMPSIAATTLVLGDQPVEDSFATLINLSDAMHGARPFQYMLPFYAPRRPFPLQWPDSLGPLRIVDVGSQELSTESDMHATLRAAAPVECIGFDPFATSEEASTGTRPVARDVVRADGCVIKTLPVLLADGREVTFHVNRYDATSSILQSNHALTEQFGLLDLAVQTVTTHELTSYRIDDVLPLDGDDARIDLLKIDVQGAAHLLLENGRNVLDNTLVCHVELEFAPVYLGEHLFGDTDVLLRSAGFCFVDFFSLGRQRYASFETSKQRAFHRGRTLWADCIYIKGLDTPGQLTADELFRAALIVHSCYNKQDLAADLLGRIDRMEGSHLSEEYIGSA